MKTHTVNTYSFNELSAEAQENAINNLSDINVNFDWWEWTYNDAKEIGIKIEGFDIDRPNYCNIKFIDSAPEIANKIMKEHGEECKTYKAAAEFLDNYDKLVAKYSDGDGEKVAEGNEEDFDNEADELEESFKQNLAGDYLKMLKDEYEYQSSREAIIETIEANDYQFLETGKRF